MAAAPAALVVVTRVEEVLEVELAEEVQVGKQEIFHHQIHNYYLKEVVYSPLSNLLKFINPIWSYVNQLIIFLFLG